MRLRKLLNAVYLYIFHILLHLLIHSFVYNRETDKKYKFVLDTHTKVCYNIHVLDNAYRLPFASYDTSFLVGKDGRSSSHLTVAVFLPAKAVPIEARRIRKKQSETIITQESQVVK